MKINMKRQGILFINYYEKQEDQLIKVDEKMIKVNRRDFEQALEEDFKKRN